MLLIWFGFKILFFADSNTENAYAVVAGGWLAK